MFLFLFFLLKAFVCEESSLTTHIRPARSCGSRSAHGAMVQRTRRGSCRGDGTEECVRPWRSASWRRAATCTAPSPASSHVSRISSSGTHGVPARHTPPHPTPRHRSVSIVGGGTHAPMTGVLTSIGALGRGRECSGRFSEDGDVFVSACQDRYRRLVLPLSMAPAS
jgi:hypothetical protein